MSEKHAGQLLKSVVCQLLGCSSALDLSLTSERRYTADPKLDRFLRITIEEFVRYIQKSPFLDRESDMFRKSIFSSVMNSPGAYIEAPDAEPKSQGGPGDRALAGDETTPESQPASPPKTDRPVSPVPKRPVPGTRKKAKPVSDVTKPEKPWKMAAERERQGAGSARGRESVASQHASVAPIRQASPPPAPVEKPKPSPDFPEIRTSSPAYERVRGGIDALREAIKTSPPGGSEDADRLMERFWSIHDSLQSGRIVRVENHADVSSDDCVETWATLVSLEQILYGTGSETGNRQPGILGLFSHERLGFVPEIIALIEVPNPDIK